MTAGYRSSLEFGITLVEGKKLASTMPAPDTNARQVPKIRSGQVRELPTVGKIVAHMPVAVEREEGKRRNGPGSHPLKTPKNYANFLEFLTHLYYLLFSFFLDSFFSVPGELKRSIQKYLES